ncbi:MAG: hypothetical protein AABX70_09015 [Nanoarchaeota archaeon]
MKKLAFLFVVFLLIVSSVQAKIFVDTYSLDYVTSSTEEGLKICSCASKTDSFRIANVGDFDSAYRVGVRSDVKDWFGFSDLTFSLQPGKKKDVGVFMNIPCNAPAGQYKYTVAVASNHDGMKEIPRPFTVVHCQNLGFELVPASVSTKACGVANFQAHIQNVGLFDDRFKLSSDEPVTFSEPSVLLKAQEERTVYGYYAVPCSASKNVKVPITLSSQNNAMVSTKELFVQVQKPMYNWEVQSSGPISLCSEVPEKVDIAIGNSADAPLDYELNVKGVDFAKMSLSQGSVARNGFEKAQILFYPKKENKGSFDVQVGLKSGLDHEFAYKSLHVEVQDCHGFSGKFVDIADKVCCGEKTIMLNIRNQGSDLETFKVFSSDVKLLDASILLRPGENGNVRFLWNAPCETNDALIRVTVVPTSRPELSRDVTLSIKVLSQEACYQVGLADKPLVLSKGDDKLTVSVKNLGIEATMYTLKLSSPFLHLPFVDLHLEPGQEKEIPLQVSGVAQYEPGSYVSDLILSPKDSSVQYIESLQVELKDSTWKLNWKHVLAVVVVLLIFISVQLVAIYKGAKVVKRKR